MAKLTTKEIDDLAVRLLKQNPGGMRFKKLVDAIYSQHPESNYNTVFTRVSYLKKNRAEEVVRPSRGLYQLATDADTEIEDPAGKITGTKGGVSVREEDFYQSFADFLKNDLDEATEAEPIGGAGLKAKWGTPDVLGAYKPQAADRVKFPMELIAGEVKVDPQQPVVAFGQAVAYRLFAHKAYIAMPSTMSESDKSRLETLCLHFGIGLVLFDLDPNRPEYDIRVRAQRFLPDWFYVNELAERLKQHNGETFEKLFG